jgi:hypothetical protein
VQTAGDGRADFESKALNDAPRLCRSDRFRFGCHPGVTCFGDCCGDVSIVLTPYDVLRLSRNLGLTTTEFLERHTILPFTKEQRIPAPLLRMGDDERKRCPFFSAEKGCTVYEDRPWACRMYPLGFASPGKGNPAGDAFWFLIEEPFCRGHEESSEQSVAEWLDGQGLAKYDEWGERYKTLAVDQWLSKPRDLEPRQMEMFYTATFDLDRFRAFVFGSSFLDRFDVAPDVVEKLKTDDEALMGFGFDWLMFSLFRRPTMKIKDPKVRERKE